ncbi:MAG TPA: nitroreductase family deazaflavin-dependent oxidoreductase [Jiangellaceae bacterium]|nr:nitroreductase family deazaflavin-dependent oxidoreductase [Jiangellaceae bacterium]
MSLSTLLRTRWLVRAPIWLYRTRLGAIFGHRLLMLEHRGRVSGQRRYVVLEVVERRGEDEYVVVAGLGPSSQWYRNIKAHPHVHVSVGLRHRVPAAAEQLDPAAAAETLERYRHQHPTAFARLEPVISEWARPLASANASDDAGDDAGERAGHRAGDRAGDDDWQRHVPLIVLRLKSTTHPGR